MSETVGPYILGKTLGTGSTGKVKEGTHNQTGERVAIKIIFKKTLKSYKSREKINREISILRFLSHPNILNLYDVYETSKYLFLIMELVEGGELFDYLTSRGMLPRSQTLVFFQQMILGLEYMHNHLICHRDLKPENLLLDKNDNLKIADFGMAQLMKSGKLLNTSCGSPHYAAPEVIAGKKYDGKYADVWCCGVILFALLSGRLPFDSHNIKRLLAKVKRGVYQMPKSFNEYEKDLISKILVVDPKKRITIKKIKKHPFFTANFPKFYKFPSYPFPKKLIGPIQSEDIDMRIINSLINLGWNKDKDEKKKKEKRRKKKKKKIQNNRIYQQDEFEQNFNEGLIFGGEDIIDIEERSDVDQEWLEMAMGGMNIEETEKEEKIEKNKFQPKNTQRKGKQILLKEKKQNGRIINNNSPLQFGDSLPTEFIRNRNKTNFEFLNESFDGKLPYGTPRFHRIKQETQLSQFQSPPNQPYTTSPKKKWFGSFLNKKSQENESFQVDEKINNVNQIMNNEQKKEIEKQRELRKLKKLKKLIKEIKRTSNDSIYVIGSKIQKVLSQNKLQFTYPHQFLLKVFSDDIKMRIEIEEISKFKYIIHFLYKKGDIKLYATKLKQIIDLLSFH
ncbi:serine/threonine-protein kinase gin4-related [Anaeramoeba flamelloides]|uniref:Serine/threonine-protein kinase gin4-related n=1 Tax=Anaeramoeba flamelloides TaxID=1746091 RepID=A0AAV7ZIH9_9EUKA|nr:serine/threonine-protein kinase gin4-related [Anaeramoeba flamelloides]